MKPSLLTIIALTLAALALVLHFTIGSPTYREISERCKLNGGPATYARLAHVLNAPVGPYEVWTCWQNRPASGTRVLVRPILYIRAYQPEENRAGFMIWEE